MNLRNYQLHSGSSLLPHGPGRGLRYLNDLSEMPTEADIDALVASGDCFITLATMLDDLSESLPADLSTVRPQLEKLTAILFYLQRHYSIQPKRSDYRQ